MAADQLSAEAHWDGIYAQRDPREVSWYEPSPEISLALIQPSGIARDAAIVDVGGGASVLAAALLADGYTDLTVADICAASLKEAKTLLGPDAELVRSVEGNSVDVANNAGRGRELDECDEAAREAWALCGCWSASASSCKFAVTLVCDKGFLGSPAKSLPTSSARMEAGDGAEGRWQTGRGER